MAGENHRNALNPGYMVHWYRIERILGQGGFGITYLAQDTNLTRQVALKEYLPIEVAVREDDHSIHPVSESHSETFSWGLERFVDEARTLARFDHPNIVRVLSVFEMNNTAYMVMRYESGQSLQQILRKGATLAENRLTEVLFPILEGLERVHAAGFVHRDVKPANIFIRGDGTPVLLDFGSARQSLGEATRTLTTLVSPGYAPFEQYFSKSDRQGPWTDVYGLGATFYRAVTGVPPMSAVDRGEGIIKRGRDPLTPAAEAAAGRYSPQLLDAIDWAIRFKDDSRPQSMDEWRLALEGKSSRSTPEETPAEMPTPLCDAAEPGSGDLELLPQPAMRAPSAKTKVLVAARAKSRRRYWIAGVALVAMLFIGVNAGRRGLDSVPAAANASHPVAPANALAATPLEQKRIAGLLEQAAADIDQMRLSTPPGDNALEKYRQVLAVDEQNQQARNGVRRIVETYVQLGRQAAQRKDYDRASFFIDQALAIAPDSKPLRKARRRLDRIRHSND
jgi:serine/threonine protein kinase